MCIEQIHKKLDVIICILSDKKFFQVYQMARGHQKELARQRNEKNGNSNKPTTQKGTAGKNFSTFKSQLLLLHFSCWFNLSMFRL